LLSCKAAGDDLRVPEVALDTTGLASFLAFTAVAASAAAAEAAFFASSTARCCASALNFASAWSHGLGYFSQNATVLLLKI
jgi:hypothetical protein